MSYVPRQPETSGVYLIENRKTKSVYVGRTGYHFQSRWNMHRGALKRNAHGNRRLQEAWNAGRPEDFVLVPAETGLPMEQLADAERRWIKQKLDEGWTVFNAYDRGQDRHKERRRNRKIRLEGTDPEHWGDRAVCPVAVSIEAVTHSCIVRCDRMGLHDRHGIMVYDGDVTTFWSWSDGDASGLE